MIGQFTAPLVPIEDKPEQKCVTTNSSDLLEGEELKTTIPDMSSKLFLSRNLNSFVSVQS